MKKLPITNFDKFEKKYSTRYSRNCEMFWHGMSTYHYQYKNSQTEGIEVKWEGNPFKLIYYSDIYVLEK